MGNEDRPMDNEAGDAGSTMITVQHAATKQQSNKEEEEGKRGGDCEEWGQSQLPCVRALAPRHNCFHFNLIPHRRSLENEAFCHYHHRARCRLCVCRHATFRVQVQRTCRSYG